MLTGYMLENIQGIKDQMQLEVSLCFLYSSFSRVLIQLTNKTNLTKVNRHPSIAKHYIWNINTLEFTEMSILRLRLVVWYKI